ncbi:MAG: hypothetical protein AAGJ35_04800, partial [Myxococcota bacterium]
MQMEDFLEIVGENDGQERAPMAPEEIVLALKHVYESRKVQHDFQAGDIVRDKAPEFAGVDSPDAPVMFLGYLDKP